MENFPFVIFHLSFFIEDLNEFANSCTCRRLLPLLLIKPRGGAAETRR